MTDSNANTSGLECVRIIACHLPEAHFPDTVCLPITITAGDLRAVYSVLVTAASAQARIDAAEARADRLADSNEGLTEDLYQAVLVAYRRGAHEWAWLNYPQWRNALAGGQEVAPIARAFLARNGKGEG